jgi:simple sugar transport system substrate-binding protein
VQQEVLAAQKAIGAGQLQPFRAGAKAPVRDNEGHEVIPAGQALTDAQILQMNWLVEGVQATLPK